MVLSDPGSPASTASILSDGEIVPTRKHQRQGSTASTASTASIEPAQVFLELVHEGPKLSKDSRDEPVAPLSNRTAQVDESTIEAGAELGDSGADLVIQNSVGDSAKRYRSPYAPYHGYQIEETPEEFLKRLPPSITGVDVVKDWIWAYNPYLDPGNRQKSDLEGFMKIGSSLLSSFDTYKQQIENSNDKPGSKWAKIKAKREDLPDNLKDVARAYGVTHGKWMLFPNEADVDKTWLKVVQGTAEGKLGTAAKVAPAGTGNGSARLICIYNKDFSDLDDVKRVLIEMKARDLLGSDSPIYYKADAWTHLGIESKNKYSIRASMYCSQDMIPEFYPKKIAQKQQSKKAKQY